MAGILHDIGKIILVNYDGYLGKVLGKASEMKSGFYEAECELFSFNHCSAGAYLLGIWGLPDSIVEAVAFHHKPSQSVGKDGLVPLALVHAANCFSARGRQLAMPLDIPYYEG
jgi:HD-like signal output (HDOD) protein